MLSLNRRSSQTSDTICTQPTRLDGVSGDTMCDVSSFKLTRTRWASEACHRWRVWQWCIDCRGRPNRLRRSGVIWQSTSRRYRPHHNFWFAAASLPDSSKYQGYGLADLFAAYEPSLHPRNLFRCPSLSIILLATMAATSTPSSIQHLCLKRVV